MRMKPTISKVRALAALALSAVLLSAGALAPSVRPVVVVAGEEGGATKVEVRLERAASAPLVGSWQGEVRFDPAALSLSGASLPNGVVGAWNQVEPGRVRFAGIAPDGIEGGAVLVLRVTSRGAVAAEQLRAELEEAYGTDGRARLAP